MLSRISSKRPSDSSRQRSKVSREELRRDQKEMRWSFHTTETTRTSSEIRLGVACESSQPRLRNVRLRRHYSARSIFHHAGTAVRRQHFFAVHVQRSVSNVLFGREPHVCLLLPSERYSLTVHVYVRIVIATLRGCPSVSLRDRRLFHDDNAVE